jgi:outer membrane protein assembly factor BamB
MRNRTLLVALAVALSQGPAPSARQQAASTAAWPQWGGPNRNFMSDSKGLASRWPASGPKKLWSRALGEGHSAIAAEGGRLYTMYRPLGMLAVVRRSQEEVIAALDATTGTTIWEHRYPSPTSGLDFSQGAGPHATPLIADDRIFAAGSRKELFALNKANGQVGWSHDLIKEYGATAPGRGYTCSPLLYNGTVIVTMGGPGQALAAFNQKTGALAWKAGDLDMSPASPILIDVDGQKQLLYFGGDRVAGFDPANGRMLWSHPHKTDWGLNISTPIWSPADHLLFVSSAYGTGSRVIALHQAGGKTTPAEKWFSGKMRVHFGTAIRIGNYVYGSSGDFGPAFLTAIDVNTGKIAWQDRAFSRAQLLYADGKLVILDEDGALGLATVTPQGMQVLAKAPVLENLAWTTPTLVGTRLYARDRKNIASFELGGQ